MKNPAKPGDSGTNETRGVVGSGMSETTKRTSHLTPFYLPSPDMADSAEMDLWERLHRDVPTRPSTFAAEGGAERETTNSPAEIGTGCTGRKMALLRMSLCAFVLTLILVDIWVVGGAWSVLGAVGLVVWVNVLRRELASGGEGV